MIPVRDPETGEHCWIDTSDAQVREAFSALVAARRARITDVFRRSRAIARTVNGRTIVDPLVKFIMRRRRRLWNTPGR